MSNWNNFLKKNIDLYKFFKKETLIFVFLWRHMLCTTPCPIAHGGTCANVPHVFPSWASRCGQRCRRWWWPMFYPTHFVSRTSLPQSHICTPLVTHSTWRDCMETDWSHPSRGTTQQFRLICRRWGQTPVRFAIPGVVPVWRWLSSTCFRSLCKSTDIVNGAPYRKSDWGSVKTEATLLRSSIR